MQDYLDLARDRQRKLESEAALARLAAAVQRRRGPRRGRLRAVVGLVRRRAAGPPRPCATC